VFGVLKIGRPNRRPVGVYRRYAVSRIAFVFVAAVSFAQVGAAQHIHALDDIDQTCVICRFSDTEDVLLSSSVRADDPLKFHEHQTEDIARVRIATFFDYRARAPPFSSYG